MPPRPLGRRTILTGTGSACALALLGACGPTGGASTADQRRTSQSRPVQSPPASVSGSAAPAPPPGFLAAVQDVPLGGGVVVRNEVLLVQPAAGTIKAYDAHCPHQGFVLPPPDAAGIVTCPNHLARYRAGDGSLIDGPAPSGLLPIPVRIADGKVLRA
jgi:nitrite reductase/ring-hydroxylating ferredoxin subunit